MPVKKLSNPITPANRDSAPRATRAATRVAAAASVGIPARTGTQKGLPLPEELVAGILSHLSDRDVLVLRRVNRDFKRQVEDAHVWHQRMAQNRWLLPTRDSKWPTGDMLAHYRAHAALIEEPRLGERLTVDTKNPDTLAQTAGELPKTLPLLRVTEGPSEDVVVDMVVRWPHLRELTIEDHGHRFIPASMVGLSFFEALETVDIVKCRHYINKETLQLLVDSVPGLRCLALRRSLLEGHELAPLAGARNLKALNLEDAQLLHEFPAALPPVPGLLDLELNMRSVRPEFDAQFTTRIAEVFPNVRYLTLAGRRLRQANAQHLAPLAALPLKGLDISRTAAKTLPPELCKPALRSLDASRNVNFSLPDAAKDLRGLRRIDLSSVELGEFPRVLTQLPELRSIDVSWNAGIQFSSPLHDLINLRELCAEFCELNGVVPAAILSARNIKRLRLAGNNIYRLPPAFARLKNLTHLDLSDEDVIWAAMPRPLRHMDKITWLTLPALTHKVRPRFDVMFPALRYLRVDAMEPGVILPRRRRPARPATRGDIYRASERNADLNLVTFSGEWDDGGDTWPATAHAHELPESRFSDTYSL